MVSFCTPELIFLLSQTEKTVLWIGHTLPAKQSKHFRLEKSADPFSAKNLMTPGKKTKKVAITTQNCGCLHFWTKKNFVIVTTGGKKVEIINESKPEIEYLHDAFRTFLCWCCKKLFFVRTSNDLRGIEQSSEKKICDSSRQHFCMLGSWNFSLCHCKSRY